MLPGRTTVTAVQSVIVTTPGYDIDQFIDAANEIVSEVCAVVFPGVAESLSCDGFPVYKPAVGGFTYTDYRLELIERWLSAHFYCVLDPRPSEEKAGDVSQRLQGRVNIGFNNSLYGQHAMRLDTMGALAVYDKGQQQYGKIPRAILQGVPIGVKSLGSRRHGWGRVGWGGGWNCNG